MIPPRFEQGMALANSIAAAHRMGLEAADVYILALLSAHLIGTGAGIARLEVFNRHTVYRRINHLVARRMVTKKRDPANRRDDIITITKKGRDAAVCAANGIWPKDSLWPELETVTRKR